MWSRLSNKKVHGSKKTSELSNSFSNEPAKRWVFWPTTWLFNRIKDVPIHDRSGFIQLTFSAPQSHDFEPKQRKRCMQYKVPFACNQNDLFGIKNIFRSVHMGVM